MAQSDAKLQTKWERRLKKAGLSIAQPMTDNSEGETQVNMAGSDDEMLTLRKKLDSNDGFMGGHQITKFRSMEREIPDWVFSNKEVQRVVLTSFPKLATRPRQRAKAAQWVRLIYLYYRMGLPMQVVARELNVDKSLVKRWLLSINRAEKGLTNADGKPRRVTSLTTSEGSVQGSHETIESPLLHRAGNGSNGEAGTPQKDVPLP
jgi:transposase-like protein